MDIQDIVDRYFKQKQSIGVIAKDLGTYPSKITRLLKTNGYALRDKSEAQSNALKQGHVKHPTKGKERPQETKDLISQKNHEVWANLTKEEKEYRSEIGKKHWESLTPEEKMSFMEKGHEGIRYSSQNGSKMERYLLKVLKGKYNAVAHKKGLVQNSKLEVDLYVSDLNLVIEVDGPSHYADIWQDGGYEKQFRADNEKTSSLISVGYRVLRIKDIRQNKSNIYFKKAGESLMELLANIENGSVTDKVLELELE